jgi:hypothetical protein
MPAICYRPKKFNADRLDKIAKAKYRGNTWSAWSEGTPKQKKIAKVAGHPGKIDAADFKALRGGKKVEEAKDTPGNGYQHQCAIHVKTEQFGEGKTLYSQHAEPDESGNIAWYDVMFEHGIEKRVPTETMEILVSEGHGNHKKKA